MGTSEHVRLVELALSEGPEDGMTGKQVWEATERRLLAYPGTRRYTEAAPGRS